MKNDEIMRALADAVARSMIDHADELTRLDQAIGDGDHGINMKRGFEAVLEKLDEFVEKPLPDALKAIGMRLVTTIGGASGPLYGTLFMELGKALPGDGVDRAAVASAFAEAIAKVKMRGKSEAGQKTMLDVLVPVQQAVAASGGDLLRRLPGLADEAAEATVPMRAIRGRASFLGERSIGHMDPGARSSALMVRAICTTLEAA